MDRHYHTVIIGAGPAGSSCGITLNRAGANVCILDKAVFPRHKTCAGLVTDKTYQLIQKLYTGKDINTLFECNADTIRLFQRDECLTRSKLQDPVRLVSRKYFDNALLEIYKAEGGVILEGEEHIKPDLAHNRIILSNGNSISYDQLVFADGAVGLSRRITGNDLSNLACCIEAYIPREMLPTDSVDLYFGYLKDGYIWAFPHGETVCIGGGYPYRKGEDYRGLLDDFLSEHGIDKSKIDIIGAFLPYGFVVPQNKLPDNVMLIGDAGGFTDPISGEGLYMALLTGMLAAESMKESVPKAAYLQSVSGLARNIKDGKRTQNLLYSPLIHKQFIKRVRGRNELVGYYFQNMVQTDGQYRKMTKVFMDYKKNKNH